MSDIDIFPVAQTTTRMIEDEGLILLKFDFLASPMQSPDRPNPGRNYALTRTQAESLIQQIQRALQKLGSASPPNNGDPKH
ncbi:MAG: hypothetical protein CMN85_10970 [Spongiibacteraceae bacterium]|uniref:hypothetical protein n=1 Tax=uncultured Haliea sp. TaxID=622616 RepID=UPI000C56D8F1|nr:hypothetical protein [Spongiibacteraceae bacterium]|tara:strand:- start:9216 stop:9458 length:243 start_codon:yes stop_codon:yes gene_type:complete